MIVEWNLGIFLTVFIVLGTIWLLGRVIAINDVLYIPSVQKKRHTWKPIKYLDRASFCNICEILLGSIGGFCDCCGVCACQTCMKKADSSLKCKDKVLKADAVLRHHWIHGNLPLNSDCCVCGEDIDLEHTQPGLYGYRCCWCQRNTHNRCYPRIESEEQCDLGEFHDMIIPPNKLLANKVRGMRKLWLKGVDTQQMTSDWKPLLVIANMKSGSSSANEAIALFKYVLHPLQVMELGSHGPEESLRWALKMAPKQSRILVAGGDGTVGWILNTIIRMNIEPMPEVSVLPLGTGNDLARVLEWGGSPPSVLNVLGYLRDIRNAEPIMLDRWLLEITGPSYRIPLKRPSHKSVFMYNYFSIGVDALVTLNFHKARESPFYVLSSRLINKLLYLCFGSHQVFIQDCAGLDKQMEVYLDGVKLELPDLQSIVFLNIDSWGAGVKLWEMSKESESEDLHSMSDGMLEVLGVVSSFHIAQMQCGIRKPLRLGQAKEIRVKLLANCPVQADGEPWLQTPCEIKISAKGQAKMLRKRAK